MRILIAVATAGLLALAGCAEPGPSLDQQQQAWEQDTRTNACEGIKMLTPGALELEWAIDDLAAGSKSLDSLRTASMAGRRDKPYNCQDAAFERFYEESLVSQFPDSPKGQAGETTAAQPR